MPKYGKKYRSAVEGIDQTAKFDLAEAVKMAIQAGPAKFDETVDVAMCLGVDPKYSDQMVRGAVTLPHGLGKTIRVAVFLQGRQGCGGQGRRSRHRWRGRPGGTDSGRHAQLRQGRGHPGHDGPGRQDRPRARTPGPDAQRQDRHRDHERDRCREGTQGRAR